MTRKPSVRAAARRPAVPLRASVAGVVAVLSLVLTGCGDPDDDDGGGGGGYVAEQVATP